ncbi:MAG: hypothetical protein HPY73_00140 [Methanomassiliicoccales archaeon]|nr:MAG: hypothetical protein HPY73_00140 [Methanomassiliicoccales archaeon]
MSLKDDLGMALIFDSLAFLTIISVIGVALMGSVLFTNGNSEIGEYVSSVHSTTLSCTYRSEGVMGLLSLKDVLSVAISTMDHDLWKNISIQMSEIFDAYLEPLYRFYYEAEMGGTSMSFGDGIVLSARDIYTSTIEIGENLSLTLSVCYA